jgi:long-chain acyl-CoA synthetase
MLDLTAEASLPELFDAAVSRWGDAVAIHQTTGDWSFRQLGEASDRVAAGLQQQGVGRGDRVGLYCPNCPEFATVYLGIVKAGATVVPINLLLNPHEVTFILDDSRARVLFYHASLKEGVARVRDTLKVSLLGVVIGGEPAEPYDRRLEDLGYGAHRVAVILDAADATAAILYTSGTTGRPKGAMLSHRNLATNARSVVQALGLRPGGERILVVLPMFHAFAATVGMLTPLLSGFSLIPVARFDPVLVTDAIVAAGATLFLGVPSMFSLLLRLDRSQVERWRTVRFCVSGGAAMPVALMQEFEKRFGIPVLEGDGPTECGPVTCVNPVEGPRKPGSVGLAVPGVAMSVRDEGGEVLPEGEIGEICVRGPSVMQGYWGLPEATRGSFLGDWFRTGDLGYRDADGYFFLVDRKKDMIIVNGMNVYPRVIEEVLYRHPAVAEVALVGHPDPLHGEVPVAYVALRPGTVLSAAEVRAWCKQYLGRHEVPRRVLFRETLPKNATGKVLKRELRREGEVARGVDLGQD